MVRASAKNHAYVAIVTDPGDYAAVINALEMNIGSLSLDFRKKLAAKAFARTAAYDAAISGWFAEALDIEHPAWRAFGGQLEAVMRYGENPHQSAGFYVTGDKRPGVATARQLQGKQLSYNNINDTDAAFELVGEFDPAAQRSCGDHQACQSLRRRRGRHAEGGLYQGAGLRSGLGLRRHRRASTALSMPRRRRRSSKPSPR